VVEGSGVDGDLPALGDAGGVEAAGVDAVDAAVLVGARPGNDEVPVAVHRHRGDELVVAGGDVDQELVPLGDAGGVEAAGVDAIAVAVLTEALPRDDEVPVAVFPWGTPAALKRRA
jgi:hypothetical protein